MERSAIRIGMPVQATFVDYDDELSLPVFVPAGTPAATPAGTPTGKGA
jgi:hypothetical protein